MHKKHLLLIVALLFVGCYSASAQLSWVEVVDHQPDGFSLGNVDSPEDLAWVISRVNGLNGQSATSTLNVSITADIDMSAYAYIPIGTENNPYEGTFSGNGHCIYGLNCSYEKSNAQGLFGYVSGNALIQHVFVNSEGKSILLDSWYLPSSGQLRKLEAAMPLFPIGLIEEAHFHPLKKAYYWSSTISPITGKAIKVSVWNGSFQDDIASYVRVRAIRDFVGSGYQIGDVYEFIDGSKGIVFYVDKDDTGGWAVALDDAASSGAQWGKGNSYSVEGVTVEPGYVNFLQDYDGLHHTRCMRNTFGDGSYSAGLLQDTSRFSGFFSFDSICAGSIAGVMSGNSKMVYCEGAAKLKSANAKSYIGGLVGLLKDEASIHSSMAMANLFGYHIGGLVGKMEGNAILENSFSNGFYGYPAYEEGSYTIDGFVSVPGVSSDKSDPVYNVKNCYTLTQNKTIVVSTGWYLPSAEELRQFYSAYTFIDEDNFKFPNPNNTFPDNTSSNYWTSSLYNTATAACISNILRIEGQSPVTQNEVRGVRTFTIDDTNITEDKIGSHTTPKLGDCYQFTDTYIDENNDSHTEVSYGVVFWVSNDRKTGKAIKTVDETTSSWGDRCVGPDCYLQSDEFVWSLMYDKYGKRNTNLMYAALGESAPAAAIFGVTRNLDFVSDDRDTYYSCYSPEGFGYPHNELTGTFTETETPYYYNHADNQVTMQGATETSGGLVDILNSWVQANNEEGATYPYATWMRPCASNINGDYPVLKLPDLTTMSNHNLHELDYGSFVDVLKVLDTIEKYPDSLKMSESAMLLYGKDDASNQEKDEKIRLYIDGEASLLQNPAYKNTYAGVTIPPEQRWHMFSSPLKDAPLGINYASGSSTPGPGITPYAYTFYDESEYDGYFPSRKQYDTINENYIEDYYRNWDFYCFDEPQYHWINFKRDSDNHWYEDTSEQITYTNETNLTPGKGYLVNIVSKNGTFFQAQGTLNTGNVTKSVTSSDQSKCQGYNLIGNPYPSYLNFYALADKKSSDGTINNRGIILNTGTSSNKVFSYVTFNESVNGYTSYASSASDNPVLQSNYIPPFQAFFIKAEKSATLYFTEDMRTNEGTSHFRDDEEQINYPLVNLLVTDSDKHRDVTVVEVGRPEVGGAVKMEDLRYPSCQMYAHYKDVNYSIAFTLEGENSVPVWFEAFEDGNFTLTWETLHGKFDYLHLIDNITGVDVDCLSANSYVFSGKTTDYKSRFKLVFSYTDVDEYYEEEEPESETFAFFANDNLVVNGEGYLELVDLNGRVLYQTRIIDVQTMVSLPDFASGLYLLRLTNAKQTKVQKIIIK